MPEILIENCQEWLADHDHVEYNGDTHEIATCNRHGDVKTTNGLTFNVSEDGAEFF